VSEDEIISSFNFSPNVSTKKVLMPKKNGYGVSATPWQEIDYL
jgi:hypothetical protein